MKHFEFDKISPLVRDVSNQTQLEELQLLENFNKIDTIMFDVFKNQSNKNFFYPVVNYILLDKIKNIIIEDPTVLRVQNKEGKNIGMLAVEYNINSLVSLSLEDPIASLQQDYIKGWNIGMHTAKKEMQECSLQALDNAEASLQQNFEGENMGMCFAYNKKEEATLKALDNKEASRQVSKILYNIGAYSVICQQEKPTLKAIKDPVAGNQRIGCGQSLDELAIIQYGKVAEMIIEKRNAESNIENQTL